MAYDQVTDFLADLHDQGELLRVGVEVDPRYEIAEITDRMCKLSNGGQALLFEKVRGCRFPVVTNLLGSRARILRGLGVRDYDDLSVRMAGLMKPEVADGWLARLKLVPSPGTGPQLWPALTVKVGPAQQVVKIGRDVRLEEFPFLTCWEGETRAHAAGLVITKDQESGARRVDRFPIVPLSENTIGLCWDWRHQASGVFRWHQAQRTPMPCAIVFGGDPVLNFLPNAPIGPDLDPFLFAGFLRGKGLEIVRCRRLDYEVPAHAEFVIEGFIDPVADPAPVGPIPNEHGAFVQYPPVPVLHVDAVTHRSNPVFLHRLVGKPPMEGFWIHEAEMKIRLPSLQSIVPAIVDCHLPRFGAGESACFVSIRKQYPLQARQIINALFGLPWACGLRLIVVVDEPVDVHNEELVWFQVASHYEPSQDSVIDSGPIPLAAVPGSRLGIDATRKWSEERLSVPGLVKPGLEIRELVTKRWPEYQIGKDPGETW